MDTLHTVLRAMRPATKSAPDHLAVFREFLAHLGRVQHKAPAKRTARPAAPKASKPARRKPARREKG